MRPKGTAAELEARRHFAASLLRDGKGIAETARLVGVHVSSVKRWKRSLEEGGLEALKSKPHPGPSERLSSSQKKRLLELLSRGARQAGYRTELWTCRRVAEVIAKEFGWSYHPGHVWMILRSLNLSPQRPEKRAREQNVDAVKRWRRDEWPRLKKGPSTAS